MNEEVKDKGVVRKNCSVALSKEIHVRLSEYCKSKGLRIQKVCEQAVLQVLDKEK